MNRPWFMATISHLPMQQWREGSIRTSTDMATIHSFEPYWTL